MKRFLKKGAIAVFAIALVAVMTSSAMALILEGRSEEMTANSSCDLAGTITITFTETDYNVISQYLSNVNTPELNDFARTPGTANYVLIRATLGGELIDINADEPRLCKNIEGDNSATGAAGDPLPNAGKLVELDEWNVEVSDISDNLGAGGTAGDMTADVTAYVYGKSGDQFFSIYVTDLQVANNWDDARTFPWIKVGLFNKVEPNDLEDNPDDDGFRTSICADIHDFGTNARLLVSLDIEPTQLTYTTSDNQIGHMLRGNVELNECGKEETCLASDTETIELCPIPEQGDCPVGYKCFIAEGTFPSSGKMQVIVRSNGATSGANTQEGIYIRSLTAYNPAGFDTLASFEYFPASGPNSDRDNDISDTVCTFESEYADAIIESGDLDGDKIKFCLTYDINPDEVTRDADGEILNPTIQFWVNITSIPCGEILNDVINAATMFDCGQANTCMYFPYVLQANTAWASGIAVTNLSNAVAVEDMEVTVTLTDSTGVEFTGMLPASMVTGKVFAFTMDGLVSSMGWEVAAGPAWLEVMGNFTMDGYNFTFSSLGFGAGVLPRLLESCDNYGRKYVD